MLRSIAISVAVVASIALVGCSVDTNEPQPSEESSESSKTKETTPSVEVDKDTLNPLACIPQMIPTNCENGFFCEMVWVGVQRCRRCACR